MKIEFRLSWFDLYQRAIEELSLVEIQKEYYEAKGWDYTDDPDTPTIFDPPPIDVLINKLESDKKKRLPIIEAACKYIKNLHIHPKLWELKFLKAQNYFIKHDDWKKFDPNDENTNESFLKSGYIYYLSCLTTVLDYYPLTPYNFLYTITDKLKPANSFEYEEFFQKENYLGLLDFRDLFLGRIILQDDKNFDGNPLSEFELIGNRLIDSILTEYYTKQIVRYGYQFQEIINIVNMTIDAKIDVLRSKNKRGVYVDEWGVSRGEQWERDLRYFASNVISPLVQIPTFFLFLCMDSESLSYANQAINNTDYENIIVSICCQKFDYGSDYINTVKEASNSILLKLKEDLLYNLCKFLVSIKINDKYFDEEIIIKSTLVIPEEDCDHRQTSVDVGIQFEYEVKEQLEALGYSIVMTPASGDQGVDIIAIHSGNKLAVQCKNYSGVVGNSAVQEVIAGKIFYDCDHACVITNSSFTPSASQLANKAGVILCANGDLSALRYGPKKPNETSMKIEF